MPLADLGGLGQPVATGMATTKTKARTRKAGQDAAARPMATAAPRLDPATLASALETFAALAACYADASDEDLANDVVATAAVRSIVECLDTFAAARNALVEQRVMLAIMNRLRKVYAKVRLNNGHPREDQADDSWDEARWDTREERREYLWKMLAVRLGDFTHDELPLVDLTAEEIRKRGGAKMAAQSVVAYLFDKGRQARKEDGRARQGRTLRLWEVAGVHPADHENIGTVAPRVFGVTLSRLKTLEFAMRALGRSRP